MQGKWALEEHLSTAENNQLWDDSGEAARNGQEVTVARDTNDLVRLRPAVQ